MMKVICVGTKDFEKISVSAKDFKILRTYQALRLWGWEEGSCDYQNDKIVYVSGYYFPQRIFDENFRIIPVKS